MKFIMSYIRKHRLFLITAVFSTLLLIFSLWQQFQRLMMFDFVDEYNNIIAAYFMHEGYELYSEIFMNRQPFMIYISYIVQSLLEISSLYELIAIHRTTIILIAFIFSIFLILRFRYVGIIFVLLYEALKFYLFGFTFQAEGLITYPLVYMFGIFWLKWHEVKILAIEYYMVALCFWFVSMMREPYIPVAGLLFLLVLLDAPLQLRFPREMVRTKILSIILSTMLLLLSYFSIDLESYWFQLVEVNKQTVIQSDVISYGGPFTTIAKIFGYPFYILFSDAYSHFHLGLFLLSSLFLFFIQSFFRQKSYRYLVVVIWLLLASVAIRPILPGNPFYSTYRILPWMSLFLIITAFFSVEYIKVTNHFDRKRSIVLFLLFIYGYLLLVPGSYLNQPVDSRETQFNVSYLKYTEPVAVFNQLASAEDTIHVDEHMSLMYYGINAAPAYPYIFYYPIQSEVEYYQNIYDEMFEKNPPVFYHTCVSPGDENSASRIRTLGYTSISKDEDWFCMHVLDTKMDKVDKETIDNLERKSYIIRTL